MTHLTTWIKLLYFVSMLLHSISEKEWVTCFEYHLRWSSMVSPVMIIQMSKFDVWPVSGHQWPYMLDGHDDHDDLEKKPDKCRHASKNKHNCLSFWYEVQLSMVNFPHLLCCDSSDQIILDIFSIKTLWLTFCFCFSMATISHSSVQLPKIASLIQMSQWHC